MYPAAFDYFAPQNLKEAVELADRYGEDAKFLAGGQSLAPLLKLRLVRPKYLIDLNHLPGLNHIKEEDGFIRCGAMSRHIQFEESELFNRRIPLVSEAAAHIADVQVRNRGTIGGALAEADPAGDWGPVVLALNARLKCVGPHGERWLEAKDFFDFAYSTKLQNHELVTEIHFPLPGEGSTGAYLKMERVAGDFAIVSVAVQMRLDEGGVCRQIGIGLGGVDVAPRKPNSVERFMLGNKVDGGVVHEACRLLDGEVDPLSDQRGSAAYKRRVLNVLFKRTVTAALNRTEKIISK